MSECIIVYRVVSGPRERPQYVADDNDGLFIWPNRDAAIAYALANKLFRSGQAIYQIVELDDL